MRDHGSGLGACGSRALSRFLFPWVATAVLAVLAAGCASTRRHTPKYEAPPPPAGDVIEQGLASWYGEPYHGRATASGTRYDMWGMTAAHRTLPFGTRVQVRNLDNGREADVT